METLARPYILSIQSLGTIRLTPRPETFETETRKNGSRDESRGFITVMLQHIFITALVHVSSEIFQHFFGHFSNLYNSYASL